MFLNVGHLDDPQKYLDGLKGVDCNKSESMQSNQIQTQLSKKGVPEFCFGTSVNSGKAALLATQPLKGNKSKPEHDVSKVSDGSNNLPGIPKT